MKTISPKSIYNDYCGALSTFCRQDKENLSFITALMSMTDQLNDFQWWHSGGGCCHFLAHLNDRRILIFHTSDPSIEITYLSYQSINQYLEIDNDGEGLGWEHDQPEYDSRFATIREDMSLINVEKAIIRVIKTSQKQRS